MNYLTWKKVTTGWWNQDMPVQFYKCKQTICSLDMVGSFWVSKMNVRNGSGNTFMRKYWYNDHYTKVNLESRSVMCDPLTSTRKSMQFISYRWNKFWTSQGGEVEVMSLMLLSYKYWGSYSGDMMIDAWLPFDPQIILLFCPLCHHVG